MAILIQSVPMKAGRFIAKIIVDCNDQSITQVDIYLRTGPFPIDAYDRTSESIWTGSNPINAPIVSDDFGPDNLNANEEQDAEEKHVDSSKKVQEQKQTF